ncbi:DUF2278 family protein [Nocardia sp. NPDC050408]|uniref:DUF2278 family protein n=1 Tax=Nocardia sp. NPDC050408 TaxID=3364319 RepID=UPI0037A2E5F7
MPLANYGLIKGRPIGAVPGSGANPHYQVHLVDDRVDYRIAVNVASALSPSEVEYLVDPRFAHPLLAELETISPGWHPLDAKPGGPGVDYIRSNLFDPRAMVPLPFDVPGQDNDLNEKIGHYVQRALGDEAAYLYAFGERWGPELDKKDKIFGFMPGNGVHDIHMNQGNVGRFARDDGVYQDGGLLVHFPGQNQWVVVFLKFQSQPWHTDDGTGHRIRPAEPAAVGTPSRPFDPTFPPTAESPDGAVRIVSALANSAGDPEIETVTLLNATGAAILLDGWSLLDRDKNSMPITGTVMAGETVRIRLVAPVILPNRGGQITLLDANGLRVDGVAYTQRDVSLPGFSVVF